MYLKVAAYAALIAAACAAFSGVVSGDCPFGFQKSNIVEFGDDQLNS